MQYGTGRDVVQSPGTSLRNLIEGAKSEVFHIDLVFNLDHPSLWPGRPGRNPCLVAVLQGRGVGREEPGDLCKVARFRG